MELTTREAQCLGVDKKTLSVYSIPDTPPALDYQDAALALLLGAPNINGTTVSSTQKQELRNLGFTPKSGKYGGGLIQLCEQAGMSVKDALSDLHLVIVDNEFTQDYEDFFSEYWEARWLAYAEPEVYGVGAFEERITGALRALGELCTPGHWVTPYTASYLKNYVAPKLGLYTIAVTARDVPPAPYDEWSTQVELNWVKTHQSREALAAQWQRRLEICPLQDLNGLEVQVRLLRPSIEQAQAFYILNGEDLQTARMLTQFDNYEYGVARVTAVAFNRLLDTITSRRLGINYEETTEEHTSAASQAWSAR